MTAETSSSGTHTALQYSRHGLEVERRGRAPDARDILSGATILPDPRLAFAPTARLHIFRLWRHQVYALVSASRAVLGTGAEALPAYRNLALASPISTPTGIAFGDNADAFVASASNGFVVRLDAATDTVRQFVPQATVVDGTAVRSIFGIARRPDGRIILADSGNHRVVEFDANGANGIVLAGTAGVPGCTAALLREPRDIAIDPSGDLLVADSGNDRIVRIDAAGSISLAYGWTCDTSDAHLLRIPSGIDIDANDDLYIADTRKSSRPSDRRHRQRVGRGGTKRRSFGRARARRTRC